MVTDSSEKSLVQILIDRSDTGFDGFPVDQSVVDRHREGTTHDVYEDEHGQYFAHPHDFISTRAVNGNPAGILVGDVDGRNCMDHPHSDLPHPIGLFVREEYRSQGIATELIHGYMDFVESNRCVIDCDTALVPFYERFEYNMIYLQSYNRGMDPTTVPWPPESRQADLDASNSPKHDIPFAKQDELGSVPENRLESGVQIRIRQDQSVAQQCAIDIQMPYRDEEGSGYTPYVLTSEAISKIDDVVSGYTSQSMGSGDFSSIGWLMPDDARTIADEIYPILADGSNLELDDRL